jgi:transcription elongation factor GreB
MVSPACDGQLYFCHGGPRDVMKRMGKAQTQPSTAKNYITPDGLQRLRDERRFLLMRERPAVTAVVAWAASNGDRSENADYQYGKRRLREIDRRIRFLTKRIDAAKSWIPRLRERGRRQRRCSSARRCAMPRARERSAR